MSASIWCQFNACLSVWFYYISFNDWITIISTTNDSIVSASFNEVTLDNRLALTIVQRSVCNYSILMAFLNSVFKNQRLIIFNFKSNIIYLHIIECSKCINLSVQAYSWAFTYHKNIVYYKRRSPSSRNKYANCQTRHDCIISKCNYILWSWFNEHPTSSKGMKLASLNNHISFIIVNSSRWCLF